MNKNKQINEINFLYNVFFVRHAANKIRRNKYDIAIAFKPDKHNAIHRSATQYILYARTLIGIKSCFFFSRKAYSFGNG